MHEFDYSIPQFVTRIRGIRMVVTLDIVSKVLHVLKVTHPDDLGSEHLRTVSKDEVTSIFYGTLFLGVRVKTPLARVLQKV